MFFKKNKKMKWWLSLGSVASIATVATAVVSCGATTPTDSTNGSPTPTPPHSTSTSISNITLNSKVLANPLQVLNDKNELTTVTLPKDEQQEFILAKYYYSGQINGSTNGIGYISNIGQNSDVSNYSDAIMMGPGDSLVLVFNQNSNETIAKMYDYINTLYFYDSSIGSWALKTLNLVPGPWGASSGAFVKFNNTGLANYYYGSQTNHLLNPPAFGIWLAKIAPSYQDYPTAWSNLLEYYGYEKNPNGDGKYIEYKPNENIGFYPLGIIPQNLWSIKQVASNAFAFTYNANLLQVPSITYASIYQFLTNASGNAAVGTQTQLTPVLSLGESTEWNFYMTGSYNQMQGQKLSKGTTITNDIAVKVNPDLVINTNLTNGVLNKNISSYIKYLTLDTIPSISNLIIIQNPISNELKQYSSL